MSAELIASESARKKSNFISLVLSGTALLSGTAFMPVAVQAADKDEGVVLEEIIVSADRKSSFSADFVQAGTFRNARLIDTPLTATVMTKELLESQQALNMSDAMKNTAGVTTSQINTVIYSNLAVRGISLGNLSNYRMNGVLPVVNYIHMPLENKSRVEVLKGAAGLYYGFASPSGVVNLVTERPDDNEIGISASVNSHGGYGGDVDISHVWGNSGLRVNLAAANTEIGVDNTGGDRFFVSAAYDWRPTDQFSLELDGEYIDNTVTEATLVRINPVAAADYELPPLLPSSANLGSEWLYADGKELNLMGKATYKFNSAISASVSAGRSYLNRTRRFSWFRDYDLDTGDGTVQVFTYPENTFESSIIRGDLAAAAETAGIEHEFIVGISKQFLTVVNPAGVGQGVITQNYYTQNGDLPVMGDAAFTLGVKSKTTDFGVFLADRMQITEWLQATIGYRFTKYTNESNTSTYETSPGTLSASVLFKPMENISLYGTYIEGLEEGGIAPGIANNTGEVLPAALSTQWEGGIKFEPKRGLLMTVAYFNIERSSSYINAANFFVQDGQAVYQGFEFNLAGEITKDLAIATSATYIDAKMDSGAASIVGKLIENTPKYTGSFFLEYKVPALEGLSLNGGVFYTGKRAVNPANDGFTPAYTLLDLGANYSFDADGHPVVLRLNAENVTGKRYWEATGAGLLAQGKPSTVKFSVSTSF
ncbi:TonB-dependent siderophore receptor [Kordiimonas pumila]|uniref:TonB-dependent siderophore receptor n=1 Tax=Kordiimonas pumila TaxID=2161677 RepID=A0ABV7D3V6_9PROT|nr:TonB-dependent siderophore receptor [Kordiimonas pumila]